MSDSASAFPHVPVLLPAVLEHLSVASHSRILDCTCGAGGHAAACLSAGAEVWGVDRDPRARALCGERLAEFGDRFHQLAGPFAEVAARLVGEGVAFDGVLADLGVSSMQLDDEERGFSLRSAADADMRMGEGADRDALDLIDQSSEAALAALIREYGEERMAGRVARALKEARAEGQRSAAELAAAVRRVIPGHHHRHPALRTFQALRIAVNGEMSQLESLLGHLPDLLRPQGRAVVISFHSLEDRLVKNHFRDGHRQGLYAAIAKRVVVADEAEQQANRRSASAKLRWAQRGDGRPISRNKYARSSTASSPAASSTQSSLSQS